ncbi:hypothetical protein Slin14017_G000690 [Septoria linicola]|nr:hypothetical protein Slin14017_G000690 [Septoria linicola]
MSCVIAEVQTLTTTSAQRPKGRTRKSSKIDDDSLSQARLARRHGGQKQLLCGTLPEHDVLDTQMFAVFYDNFLPPLLSPWRSVSYLASVAGTVPGTPLLKSAKRAFGLVHLAQQSQNTAILQESRISYGRLLGLLNYALQCPDKETRDILVTMSLMTHMSNTMELAAQKDVTWAVHLQAAQHLLMLQGPRHLQVESAVDQGIVRHICGNSFWLAIANRKGWSIHRAWLKMQTKGWADMLEVFHDLPTILQDTDATLAREDNIGDLLKLVSRLHHIMKFARSLFTTVQDRLIVGISELKKGGIKDKDRLLAAGSYIFSGWYAPMNQMDALKFILMTLLSLITECTILRIWIMCPETVMLIPSDLQRSIYQNSDRLARRLCRISPSLMQADGIVSVLTLELCLRMAYNVFEQQQATAEMNWSSAALSATSKRLDLVRANGVPTLCKLEQVIPGIVEAGRYGSAFDLRALTLSIA